METIPVFLENIHKWEEKNYYERLGVSFDATKEEVNKAFRRISMQYHPDKVNTNEVLRTNYEKIQALLSEARVVLEDQSKREVYNNKLGINNSKKDITETIKETKTFGEREKREQIQSFTRYASNHKRNDKLINPWIDFLRFNYNITKRDIQEALEHAGIEFKL